MKRLLLAGLCATWAVACSDAERSPVGPESLPVAATHVPGGSSATSCMPAGGAPGLSSTESPCDAYAQARHSNHHPGVAGFFFRAPTASTPPTGNFVPGFEDALKVVAYQFVINPDGSYSPAPGNKQIDISGKTPVTVRTDATGTYYGTSWKLPRLTGKNPADEFWRVWVSLDAGGSSVDLGFRDIAVTANPFQGQPLDSRIVYQNDNSNFNIYSILDDSGGSCFGTAIGQGFVQCVADLNQGAELKLDDTELIVASGSQGGVVTITGTSACEGVTGPNGRTGSGAGGKVLPSELLDIPTWDCKNFTFEQGGQPANVTLANGSCILFENLDNPFDPADPADDALELAAAVHMVDDNGILVLPPVTAAECASFAAEPNILKGLFDKFARLIGVRDLVATAAVGHGSAGGGLGGISPGSDFVIARPAYWQALTPLKPTVAAFGSTNVRVQLWDHANNAVGGEGSSVTGVSPDEGGTVHFIPDAATGGSVACLTDLSGFGMGADCFPAMHGTSGFASQPHVDFVTGDLVGIAEVVWTVGNQKTKLWAGGCATAADFTGAQRTPPDGGFPGDAGPCDLDFAGDAAPAAGYDLGPIGPAAAGESDKPFVPPLATSTTPVYANDPDLEFEAQVCGTPDVTDGVQDAVWTDPNCTEQRTDVGPINLSGGGPGSQPDATLYWLQDGTNLYLGLKLPRPSLEENTTVAYEFDSGPGSDATANVGDDLLELNSKKTQGRAVVSFIDRHLDTSCLTGNSICSAADATPDADHPAGGTPDGMGSIGFDAGGSFMWYEMKHDLNSGDPLDISVIPGLAGRCSAGVFVRIAVGNSQAGGTVWPGLRDYSFKLDFC